MDDAPYEEFVREVRQIMLIARADDEEQHPERVYAAIAAALSRLRDALDRRQREDGDA